MTPHHFTHKKWCPRPICGGCGLVLLKTPLTEWATRRGCDFSEDAGWRDAVRRLTR